jgi:hypothetical protein
MGRASWASPPKAQSILRPEIQMSIRFHKSWPHPLQRFYTLAQQFG